MTDRAIGYQNERLQEELAASRRASLLNVHRREGSRTKCKRSSVKVTPSEKSTAQEAQERVPATWDTATSSTRQQVRSWAQYVGQLQFVSIFSSDASVLIFSSDIPSQNRDVQKSTEKVKDVDDQTKGMKGFAPPSVR